MQLCLNVRLHDMLGKFKNGSGLLKNMAACGRGSIYYMAVERPCEHSRSHNCCQIIMKLGGNIVFTFIFRSS
jgi:hypothetical protein